jgi:hypothetical protein
MLFGWERLDLVRRWFLCVVRRLVPWSASWRPRQLPPITIWIPFVRAFNNRVKTLVLYRLTAFVLDGTPTSVFGVRASWGCKLSVISRSPMLAS